MKSEYSIVFVELQYPYGKPRVFQSGSLIAIASWFIALQYKVSVLDFNIHSQNSDFVETTLSNASHVCISLTGTPYVPDAIAFAKKMTKKGVFVVIGGQGAESLSQRQFDTLFSGTNAVRIAHESEIAKVFHVEETLPSVFNVSYAHAWETLDEKSIVTYLTNEMTLVVSQGCKHSCSFCAAKKGRLETFRELEVFESDLRYVAYQAKSRGISKIRFYASSLDFFQSPTVEKKEVLITTIESILLCMARIRKESGVDIQTRCLSTMQSFLIACKRIPDLKKLLQEAGLYRIGFGVDGSDPLVWKSQKKNHNKPHQAIECIETTKQFGVCCEVLMVVGFLSDTVSTLYQNIVSAFRYSKHDNVILRAYMAKSAAPGNDGWNEKFARPFLEDPTRFQQIDYCAFASSITHPSAWHRFISNVCYAMIMLLFSLSKRSVTYPVFPIRGGKLRRGFARFLNNQMPGVD
jgi:hypothetical protein